MKYGVLMWLAFGFFPCFSYAFKISPIELDFKTKGPASVQTINVENTTDAKIPVEVNAYQRLHLEGKEKRITTNDFYYFPKQFILKPGEKRNIRISWMGERPNLKTNDRKALMKKGNTKISSEKAYRMEIRQVPVNLKKKKNAKTGIKFLYNYVASLYVKPEGVKPQIKVLSYRKKSKDFYEFDLMNSGGEHAILAYYHLNIQKEGSQKPFVVKMTQQKDEIKGINLLSGEKRKVLIRVPSGILSPKGAKFAFVKGA